MRFSLRGFAFNVGPFRIYFGRDGRVRSRVSGGRRYPKQYPR